MIALIVVLTFIAAVTIDHFTLRFRETRKDSGILATPSPSHS